MWNRIADMLVVVGPSGAGKSTMISRLIKEHPTMFGYSVSHTTRGMRSGEVNGQSYHFVDVPTFTALLEQKQFIEHANVHTDWYGTSFTSVKAIHDQNKICMMDLDLVGAQNVRAVKQLKTLVVFIFPPSFEVLENRLRARGTETEERLQKRLTNAVKEMAWAKDNMSFFDATFVNTDKDVCYDEFADFVFSHGFTRVITRSESPESKASRDSTEGVSSEDGASPNRPGPL